MFSSRRRSSDPLAEGARRPPRTARPKRLVVLAVAVALLALGASGAFAALQRQRTPVDPAVAAWSPDQITPAPTLAPPTMTPTITPKPSATPKPTATPLPVPRVTNLEQTPNATNTLPLVWTARGTTLDGVRKAYLEGPQDRRMTLNVTYAPDGALVLTLDRVRLPLNGEVAFGLSLDGTMQEIAPIVLRDLGPSARVRGVRKAYSYTKRILSDGGGIYSTVHAEPNTTSPFVAPLRNGEQVAVINDSVDNWFQVRILASIDPAQIGKIGWIERWLIEDKGAPVVLNVPQENAPTSVPTAAPGGGSANPPAAALPPAPTSKPKASGAAAPKPVIAPAPPATRVFVAAVVRSFAGSGQSGRQQACVQGRVQGRDGQGVSAAVVSVNNGSANIDRMTNGQGEFSVCALGDSTWSVVLRYVPGTPLAREVVGTVYVNGSAEQIAVVNFREA